MRIVAQLLLITCLSCGRAYAAEVTIDNPKHLPVKEAEVELLYTIVCQQIAETYHVRDYRELQEPVLLVLGAEDERYTIDHSPLHVTIYLREWNEARFAAAAVMVAFYRVLSTDQFKLEVTRILTRFESIKPQPVSALRRRP